MKFLIILCSVFMSLSTQAFYCNATLDTLRGDASTRHSCIARMTDHYIVLLETDMLRAYKEDLAKTDAANDFVRHTQRYHGNFNSRLEKLILLKEFRTYVNLSSYSMKISNPGDISLTCDDDEDED